MAVGEAAAIAKETRDRLKHDPFDILLCFRLVDALAEQGNARIEVRQFCSTFDQASAKRGENGKFGATRGAAARALFAG